MHLRVAEQRQNDTPGLEHGAEALKRAFREHPVGVAVLAAATPDGPVGLTVSSVASVSTDPPTLSFSVTRATGSAGGILGADTFTVQLLDARHAEIAHVFATSGADRFAAGQGWSTLQSGEPFLSTAHAVLRCRALHTLGVGPSVIVVAEVLDAVFGQTGRPMVYRDREFIPLPETSAQK